MGIRIALVDDHRMFRDVLRIALAAEPGIEVVAEGGSGAEALALLATLPLDVLVLDIALPDMSGVEVARRVGRDYPGLAVVALSGYADRLFIDEMLKAGALGYVLKSSGADELIMAIHAVAGGRLFLSAEVADCMLNRLAAGQPGVTPPVTVLGKREQDVLRLIAAGKRSAEIASALGVAIGTVSVHRSNLKKKLGLTSTAELTRYAIREGLHAS